MKQLFKGESATGVLLIIATVLAMAMANSPLDRYYNHLIDIPVVVSFDTFVIAKPLLLWINDGLMAIFFFMVGLEIKREVLIGNLKESSKVVTPALAAMGGMILPALIYTALNGGDEAAMRGWAIPMATDIAFALGILSLLGERVPKTLKVFLLALAIIDDLGAIVVIALFYGHGVSVVSLAVAAFFTMILAILNMKNVKNPAVYIVIGVFLWVAVLKSGVHATIAGVILGLFIPLKENQERFLQLEHSLHFPVNYIILPIFAFVNTGIAFSGMSFEDIGDTITLGIAFGLFIGKTVGIFLFSYISAKLGIGKIPQGVDTKALFGVSILAGIGFTMSLFIGSLAFECNGGICFDIVDERLGILLGSLLSGIVGFYYLKSVLPNKETH